MRILITGGAGFLGSHLCDRLIKEGHSVICMDNLITGSLANIAHLRENKDFRFIRQDVTEYIKIDEPIDYVLHFASPASPIDYQKYPIQTLKVGALGAHKTLGLAKAKTAKFLLASTSEVYGDPLVNPQREDYRGNVNAIGPRGMYDEAKRFAEALIMAYHRYHGINTRIARIFNTFGERMRKKDGRVVPTFITQALANEPLTVFGDGSQTRSFCYVSDMIEGLYKLMLSVIHEPINLGNPQEMTILDFAKKIIELTKSKSKIVYKPLPKDDPKVRRPDISKAKKLLNWKPKISLEEGLSKTIEWFRESMELK
ncbi:MAG: NAD-dependent epimerase/dehydratase family protein [Firmicutes bacterium]|nr:NAD-dependent epimerase/dehydratase family protein [Bacillota bacterium]